MESDTKADKADGATVEVPGTGTGAAACTAAIIVSATRHIMVTAAMMAVSLVDWAFRR
jgi:hypothetical protein